MQLFVGVWENSGRMCLYWNNKFLQVTTTLNVKQTNATNKKKENKTKKS